MARIIQANTESIIQRRSQEAVIRIPVTKRDGKVMTIIWTTSATSVFKRNSKSPVCHRFVLSHTARICESTNVSCNATVIRTFIRSLIQADHCPVNMPRATDDTISRMISRNEPAAEPVTISTACLDS